MSEQPTTGYFVTIGQSHLVTGTLKDIWKFWRVVQRVGYVVWHRQVSNDTVSWKDV